MKYKRNNTKLHTKLRSTLTHLDNSLCDAFMVLNKLLTAQRSDQTS